ncbi:hypothetical protein K8T06_06305, partial [bacterium]|nr:hypothetical protein [bacterium]
HEKIDHIALSIQAVEHKPTSCHIALDLNTVCSLNINNIMDYFADGPFHPIHRAFFKASKRIKNIELEINNAKSDQQAVARKKYMPMIPSILNEIRLEILRINHRYQRRTIHADKRINDNRPVSRAIKDLMKIDSEFILEDPRNQTILAPGKNNRWHVFSQDGRLVTSLFLEKEQVLSRVVRKRWRKPDSEKLGAFIQQMQKLYPGC